MKTALRLLVVVFMVAFMSTIASAASKAPYVADYQEALKKAGDENKEILVKFYTDW